MLKEEQAAQPAESFWGYVAANLKAVALDAVIVYALTAVCGFFVGFYFRAVGGPALASSIALHKPNAIAALAISNAFANMLGFFIVGFRAPQSVYWRHLWAVAVLAWLSGLLNVFFFHVAFLGWFFGILAIALFMGLGGGFARLTRPRKNQDAAPPA